MKRSTKGFIRRGRATRADTDRDKGKLTQSEEEILAEHILQLAHDGYHVSTSLVRETVHYIACQRNAQGLDREQDRQHVENNLPGRNWVNEFVKDKPNLKEKWKRKVPKTARELHVYDDMDTWLQRLQPSLESTKMLQENVYQLAMLVGTIEPPGVVFQLSSENTATSLAAGNRNHKAITIVECVSASGKLLLPWMIQPYRAHTNKPHYRMSTIVLAESEDGLPTRDLFQLWMSELFEPQTRDRAGGRPRVLIMDPLASYSSDTLRAFCKDANIVLCQAGTLVSKRVGSVCRDTKDLVQTLCTVYGRVFGSMERRLQRDFVYIYEQVRLNTSELLTLNRLVPDGCTACEAPESSPEWSQVLQEHKDHDATSVTRLGISKLIGTVEDDLLNGRYNLEAKNRIKQLIDTTKMLLKANEREIEYDNGVME